MTATEITIRIPDPPPDPAGSEGELSYLANSPHYSESVETLSEAARLWVELGTGRTELYAFRSWSDEDGAWMNRRCEWDGSRWLAWENA